MINLIFLFYEGKRKFHTITKIAFMVHMKFNLSSVNKYHDSNSKQKRNEKWEKILK